MKSLALLGPMGLTPSTGKTVARIMVVQFFPLPWLQDWAAQWALGKDPGVLGEAEAWLRIMMTGMQPKVTLPVTIKAEDLQAVDAPTLLILGSYDNLTGDPKDVEQLARNVPGIRIEVLDTGHLIGIEAPEQANELLAEFLAP